MRIEDLNSISEALKAERVNKIFIGKGKKSSKVLKIIDDAKKRKIPVINLPDDKLRISADVSPISYTELDDIIKKCLSQSSFMLILDSVEDVHNVGAVIRTAEFFGCAGVLMPKRRSAGITDAVAKVSAGAVFHMKVSRVSNISNSIKKIKKYGIDVVGIEIGGEPLERASLSPPVAFVVGGEDRGISNPVKKMCDSIVEIKGSGKIDSLNLSVASSIVMYEFVRRLRNEG